jgi:hypothetical protein
MQQNNLENRVLETTLNPQDSLKGMTKNLSPILQFYYKL